MARIYAEEFWLADNADLRRGFFGSQITRIYAEVIGSQMAQKNFTRG